LHVVSKIPHPTNTLKEKDKKRIILPGGTFYKYSIIIIFYPVEAIAFKLGANAI